jgi:1,2-dihydroxy-3-keto-5-methylthiopentene dioxygenase
MSELTIFNDNSPGEAEDQLTDPLEIAVELGLLGVRFEQWDATGNVNSGDPQDRIIAAYQQDINQLIAEEGYQTVDVVSMAPDHPEAAAFRQKFLAEHTHAEDEVRFFVSGQGLFSLHIDDMVYEILCNKGDLLGVPANTPHWFDMGPRPEFAAIRLFNNPEGWVAQYTGSDIADNFSRLKN